MKNWKIVMLLVGAVALGVVAQADLTLYYPCNEGSGVITSNVLVPDPNTATDMTLISTEWGTTDWGVGKYGNCVEMSGNTYSYINATVGTPASWVDAVETGDPNSMTLAVWINITTSAKYTPSIAGAQDAFLLKLAGTTSSTRKPYFKITDSAGTIVEAAWDTEFAASEWTHLVGSFDGATVKLYVNGTKVAEEPFSGFSGWKQDPPLAGIGKLWPNLRHSLQGRYDEVRIYDEALSAADILALFEGGFAANTPAPEDEEPAELLTTTSISWTPGDDAALTAQYLYGTFANPSDPNLYLVATLGTTDGNYGTETGEELNLQESTSYAWHVDNGLNGSVAGDDANGFAGAIWTFTMASPDPIINSVTPLDQGAKVGDDPSIVVDAENPMTGDATDLTYQWYKVGTPDTAISGATSATLSFLNIQKAHEGQFYCKVALGATTVDADVATIFVIQTVKLSEWNFDDDLTDAVGDFDGSYFATGTPVYDVNTVTGTGKSLVLTADDPNFVTVAGSQVGLDPYRYGYTVNMWVNLRTPGSLYDAGSLSFNLHHVSNARLVVNPEWTIVNYAVPNTWQMLTVVYDADTLTRKMYVDGRIRSESTSVEQLEPSDQDLTFGGIYGTSGPGPLSALLDTVALYDYPMDPVDIGYLYVNTTPEDDTACIYEAMPEDDSLFFDKNTDCKIDILDFAEFAADWLDCYSVPDCL